MIALLLALAYATPPSSLSVSIRAVDATGAPRTDTVDATASLFSSADSTVPLWTEPQSDLVLVDGLATVALGRSNPLPSDVFDGRELWFELSSDGVALDVRRPVTVVPYAETAQRIAVLPDDPVVCDADARGWLYLREDTGIVRLCGNEGWESF